MPEERNVMSTPNQPSHDGYGECEKKVDKEPDPHTVIPELVMGDEGQVAEFPWFFDNLQAETEVADNRL